MHVISPLTRRATHLAGRTVRGVGLLGLSLGERVAVSAAHRLAGLAGHEVRRSDPDQEPLGTTADLPSPTESDSTAPPPGPMGTPSAAEWRAATESPAPPEAGAAEPAPEPQDVQAAAEPQDVQVPAETDTAQPEAELEDESDEDLRTPSGIPAAGPGYNPDTAETDLHQPDTEPLMDPGTAKALRSEAKTLSDAADRDKG